MIAPLLLVVLAAVILTTAAGHREKDGGQGGWLDEIEASAASDSADADEHVDLGASIAANGDEAPPPEAFLARERERDSDLVAEGEDPDRGLDGSCEEEGRATGDAASRSEQTRTTATSSREREKTAAFVSTFFQGTKRKEARSSRRGEARARQEKKRTGASPVPMTRGPIQLTPADIAAAGLIPPTVPSAPMTRPPKREGQDRGGFMAWLQKAWADYKAYIIAGGVVLIVVLLGLVVWCCVCRCRPAQKKSSGFEGYEGGTHEQYAGGYVHAYAGPVPDYAEGEGPPPYPWKSKPNEKTAHYAGSFKEEGFFYRWFGGSGGTTDKVRDEIQKDKHGVRHETDPSKYGWTADHLTNLHNAREKGKPDDGPHKGVGHFHEWGKEWSDKPKRKKRGPGLG